MLQIVPDAIKEGVKASLYRNVPYGLSQALDRRVRHEVYARMMELREVYEDRGFIFVHVPRTAGISISEAFLPEVGTQGHTRAWNYRMVFGKEEYEALFKFAFVRNPWDRLVSSYRYLSTGGYGPQDRAWAKRHLEGAEDLNTFVLERLSVRKLRSHPHLWPQIHWVADPAGRIEVDFVGRFENLEEDFSKICAALRMDRELPHRNTSPRKDRSYRECYTPEAAAKVADLYRDDVDAFDYEF